MEIIFKTYVDMILLEKLLTSRGYTPPKIGMPYYEAFTENNIRTFMSNRGSLVFMVDIIGKTYEVKYFRPTTLIKFSYPLDAVSIKSKLLIPTYLGRTINKK